MFSVGTAFRLPVPIGRVWRLLVDIDRYGDWHPTLRFTNRPGDEERVDYVYAPRASQGPELTGEGMIVNLDWLSGFAWRTGMRGVLVIEESYRLEKLGQGVEVTHRLSCSGLFRSEEHTSELQSLIRISYAVFCLITKKSKI